jgi:hypothetical protein
MRIVVFAMFSRDDQKKGREGMKAGACFAVWVVFTGILCAGALGEVVLPPHEEAGLIGPVNPMLAGIERVHVVVEAPDSEPNKDGLVWAELEAKANAKLVEAGLVRKGRAAEQGIVPSLRLDVDMLKVPDWGQYVFRVQTSLATKVELKRHPSQFVQADVWKANPVMQAASIQSMPEKVTEAVLDQVAHFIGCHQVANPKDTGAADGNSVGAALEGDSKPIIKASAVKYKYVASKKSKVFHKSDCRWVERIKKENLVGYSSREEAIKAGKRPCKRCKP